MGTADTVSRTVDALLNDWAQIVHLYSIVHDLAEYFKMGKFYKFIGNISIVIIHKVIIIYCIFCTIQRSTVCAI